MTAYYNEFDPQAAEWLRELIKRGLIADGDVDERDMREVEPDELKGYTQHHFFAGIGGWSLALRLAGWADDRPVLTGSPPCQPFSSAGKRSGIKDERHLAPHFLRLVAALRPPVLFGEQVAAAVKKDNWLDDLLDALEGEGYATGAAVLPACGVGSPHIRQRLWFTGRLGNSERQRLERHSGHGDDSDESGRLDKEPHRSIAEAGCTDRVADSEHRGKRSRGGAGSKDPARHESRPEPSGCGEAGGLANRQSYGLERCRGGAEREGPSRTKLGTESGRCGEAGRISTRWSPNAPAPGWDAVDWIFCRDGKWRPAEPGTFPLAHGIPARVGRLRGYGNAIVPQVAVEIIRELI